MELRRLRLLHEFERRGTIAAVAEALAYSPSSVSVQLAELEREAGVPLLRRRGRTLELTTAGRRLAEHAAAALSADESVRAELAALSGAPRGLLRMTFVQTPALALLSTTLSTLAETAPDLRVDVVQSETTPALADLRSRAVDLVVGVEYDPIPVPRHRDVDRRDLMREHLRLVLPVDHPLARADPAAAQGAPLTDAAAPPARSTTPATPPARSTTPAAPPADAATPAVPLARSAAPAVSLADLERATWAAGMPGSGHSAVIEHLCNRFGGYAPDIHHRTDDGLILRALVASGQAVTMLAALIATETPGVAVRPIAETAAQRTIFTAARAATVDAPAIVAVRAALRVAAERITSSRDDVLLLSSSPV